MLAFLHSNVIEEASGMKQVVCAVIRDGDRVLLARRAAGEDLAGHWELPGGKVETGETLPMALTRELAEELGVTARVGTELGRSVHHYERGSIELIALATQLDGDITELTVHDAVQWCAAAELDGLAIAPADIPLLEVILATAST